MSDRDSREDLVRRPLRGVPEAMAVAVEDYTDYLIVRNYAPKGIESRREHLEEFGSWLREQGIEVPELVTRHVLTRYQAWMHARPMRHGRPRSIGTQTQRLCSLRMFFRYLTWSERIPPRIRRST